MSSWRSGSGPGRVVEGIGDEAADGCGIQAPLHLLDALVQGLLGVVRQDRDRLLGEDRAVVDLDVATWMVVPVTLTPAASASRTACHPLNAGSSAGWLFRTRPGYASVRPGTTVPKPAMTTRSMAWVRSTLTRRSV